jgi:hypothetical protein
MTTLSPSPKVRPPVEYLSSGLPSTMPGLKTPVSPATVMTWPETFLTRLMSARVRFRKLTSAPWSSGLPGSGIMAF